MNKRLTREELEELTEKTKFGVKEVRALYSRFRRLAPHGTLNREQFRNTMGVLGLTDNTFLPDRMFKVFDADGDDALNFEEFATSLAVMIRGSEDEKLRLSFDMTAGKRGAKGISNEDFHSLIDACGSMMNSLVAPTGGMATREDIDRLFHDLSSDDGGACLDSDGDGGEVITWEAYKSAAQGDEAFLQCLGLKPNTGVTSSSRRSPVAAAAGARNREGKRDLLRSSTAVGLAMQASPGTSQAPSLVPNVSGATVPAGQHVVSQAQLEELRERVSRLNVLLQQGDFSAHHTLGGRSSPSAPSRSSAPAISEEDEDLDERWWTPLPKRAILRQGGSSGAPSAVLLDEVTAELDRMLGWCAVAEGGIDSGLTSMAAFLGGPAAISQSRLDDHGPSIANSGGRFEPARRDSSRDSGDSADTNTATFMKTNVHKTRTSKNLPTDASILASQASRDGEALGKSEPRRERSFSANTRRTHKKHRLLGPRKGLAVHFGHENWNMVVSMMIGIRMAVGRSKHEMQRELQPCDFWMKEKFSIVPRMANVFDSTVSKRVTMTRFVDYAPMVFQRIRQSFGINHDVYMRSVGPEQLLGNMVLGNLSSLSELSSEGKSGAFFYYTADGNYMLKTVTPKEYLLLKKMLKGYHDHIFSQPGTLLVRFLGLHCLSVRKTPKGISCGKASIKKLYFVVMANMFNTPFEIHRRYDLKGSWIGRQTPPEKYDPSVALKDVDFQNANECIRVGEERKEILVKQLEEDSNFLASQGIIDYSVLLGIHEISASGSGEEDPHSIEGIRTSHSKGDWMSESVGQPSIAPKESTTSLWKPCLPGSPSSTMGHKEVPVHRRDAGGMLSSDKRSRYFLGVIDILTPYDTMKILEHRIKGLRWDSKGVSCCPPPMYAERFNKFMRAAFA